MSRATGDIAESAAVEFLKKEGCRIVGRNVSCRFGEIDIVAEKSGVLHFVEVKSGRGFEPIYNITPAKLSKLLRTIEWYIQKKRIDMPYQLDALVVKGSKCEWIENITI
ncbi:predicted endonuclease distantly related to archaeal Holliday junction resolvase [Hydrogenimonas sp.]|nr:predicted endonuclease distantly related to archaeal Holliday junction resolvase [Hydrogenimonas sp.]